MPSRPEPTEDPRTLRALAHPARMAVLDALSGVEDGMTATECAGLTGLSPSATAYHLNLLARYGFVEPAAGRPDARERPWRRVRRTVRMVPTTPAESRAASTLIANVLDRAKELALRSSEHEMDEPPEWRIAALSGSDLWLTAAEAQSLAEEADAALQRFRDRPRDERPADARAVRIMHVVLPYPPREEGGPQERSTNRGA